MSGPKTESYPQARADPTRNPARSAIPTHSKQPRRGELAAFNDLAHRSGTLHVDLVTSTVFIQRDDGYEATYDLDGGQLLKCNKANT
ncbi:hypothetical protein ACIQG8_07605 [Pseudarthrobacter oxydans]|uniref:hypothetical protein n=1 Tax=Pseudarthrobacter oxydans TaxID=1671 RepID=UPI003818BE9A